MSITDLQLAINTGELMAETLTNEQTDNSMDLRLAQKHNANSIEQIRSNYAPEKERINNEIESLDKVEQRDEYQDLMAELKEIKDQEEAEINRKEDEMADYEAGIQLENESLKTRLEAVQAQTDSFKEMLKQNIESEFGYFQ